MKSEVVAPSASPQPLSPHNSQETSSRFLPSEASPPRSSQIRAAYRGPAYLARAQRKAPAKRLKHSGHLIVNVIDENDAGAKETAVEDDDDDDDDGFEIIEELCTPAAPIASRKRKDKPIVPAQLKTSQSEDEEEELTVLGLRAHLRHFALRSGLEQPSQSLASSTPSSARPRPRPVGSLLKQESSIDLPLFSSSETTLITKEEEIGHEASGIATPNDDGPSNDVLPPVRRTAKDIKKRPLRAPTKAPKRRKHASEAAVNLDTVARESPQQKGDIIQSPVAVKEPADVSIKLQVKSPEKLDIDIKPLDLAMLPSRGFVDISSCFICGLRFPKSHTGTKRRSHTAQCGASRSLTEDIVAQMFREESARLDMAARAQERLEEERKTLGRCILEQYVARGDASRAKIKVRDAKEDEMWDCLGFSRNHDRRKASEIALADVFGTVAPSADGETPDKKKTPRKRKVDGDRGCLLIAPRQGRSTARDRTEILLRTSSMDCEVKEDEAVATDSLHFKAAPSQQQKTEAASNFDYDTGDVKLEPTSFDWVTGSPQNDVQPVFSFPADQRLAEEKFTRKIKVEWEASQRVATQHTRGDPCLSSSALDPYVATQSLPPSTQMPSSLFLVQSSSRLARRRPPVPGAGRGLGFAPNDFSQSRRNNEYGPLVW